MKKFLTLLLFLSAAVSVFFMGLSCSTTTPTAANNFQNPVLTVAAINTPYSPTPTRTLTFTPTFTMTFTLTPTTTPFVTATPWTGFSTPEAIAAYNDPVNGGLFIADTGNNQVDKYNFSGSISTGWGAGGKGKGKIAFNHPLAVAVDDTGNLYVVGGIPGVAKYDSNGNYLTQFTNVTFTNPQGLGVDGSGNIYVSDTANNRIVGLSSNGALLGGFASGGALTIIAAGSPTPTPGTAVPYGLAVSKDGNIAVAASDNNIHIYYPSGSPNTTIPYISSQAFNNPQGVAFDTGSNLFVADTGYHRVEAFANYALNGSPIVIFNNNGSLVSPTGVAVDGNGNIYVTDSSAGKVIPFTP